MECGNILFYERKSESLVKKVLTHPCIVAIYLGLFVMIAGMSFPVSVAKYDFRDQQL